MFKGYRFWSDKSVALNKIYQKTDWRLVKFTGPYLLGGRGGAKKIMGGYNIITEDNTEEIYNKKPWRVASCVLICIIFELPIPRGGMNSSVSVPSIDTPLRFITYTDQV